MARCDYPGCDWVGKADGVSIHKARIHHIHPVHEDVGADTWCEIKAEFEDGNFVGFSIKDVEISKKGDRLLEPIVERWSP